MTRRNLILTNGTTIVMSRPSHQWDTSSVRRMKIEEESTVPATNLPPIIDYNEAERFVESLRKFDLTEVGNAAWMEQHRRIEKLNLQAHQNAMSNSDEYVMEAVLTFDKLGVLIHDLILIEAWKESVYPLLVDDLAGRNNMRLYFILYHEATLVNLFEVFFYYKHVIEAAGEKMLDMVDYISRKLTRLNSANERFRQVELNKEMSAHDPDAAKEFAANLEKRTPKEELDQHWLEIEYRICVTSVSLARFVCEQAEVLPLGVVSRISDTHDFLLLIIPLIENPPWTRRLGSGKWQKLIDLKWSVVKPIDLLKVTKLEGQPWIALYHLLAKEVFRERYALNSFRKGQLLRIRKYLNEIMLDQLPFLADVQRYMDELAVTNVPEAASLSDNVFLFQQVAAVTDAVTRGKNMKDVAAFQKEHVFTMTDRTDKDLLALAEMYSDDAIEHVLDPEGAAAAAAEATLSSETK